MKKRLPRALALASALLTLSQPLATADDSQLRAMSEPLHAEKGWCLDERSHCYEIDFYVALDDDREPVAPAEWILAQLDESNRLFDLVDIGFEVGEVTLLDSQWQHIADRETRDLLGRPRFEMGIVPVYVVGQLDNVDDDGEINGVHWRDREDRDRRWIILSQRAWALTLAHELGHFFGLPHGEEHTSLMNKARREITRDELTFTKKEQKKMKRRRKRHEKNGRLVPITTTH